MKNPFSIAAIVAGLLFITFSFLKFKIWEKHPIYTYSGGDAFGYYVYLPAIFIHHDLLTLDKTFAIATQHDGHSVTPNQANKLGYGDGTAVNDHIVIKYTVGVAFLQAPFFLIAHVIAPFAGLEADGYSIIYSLFISISLIVYLTASLILLRKMLLRFFNDKVVALALLIIPFCTSVFYMIVFQNPMAHVYLFFLYTLLIYLCFQYYESFSARKSLWIGIVGGLIVLTRFNEVYALIIPFAFGLFTNRSFKQHLLLFKQHWHHVFIALIGFFIGILPQLIIWKMASGHFIFDSYPNEHFNFLHPKIKEGLFYFSNGWLAYHPIMYLSLIGLFFLWRKKNVLAFPLTLFLIVHIYMIYSWWCWFYMGGHGSRPMVEAYPLLLFPMCYTLEWFLQRKITALIVLIFILITAFVNVNQAYLIYSNSFLSESANWKFAWQMIGKKGMDYNSSVVMDCGEFQPTKPKKIRNLLIEKFDDTSSFQLVLRDSNHRDFCNSLLPNEQTKEFIVKIPDANVHAGQWIKASVDFKLHGWISDLYNEGNFIINFVKKGKSIKWRGIRAFNKFPNSTNEYFVWSSYADKWGRVHFYARIPKNFQADDEIQIFFQNGKNHTISIDNLAIELYED